MKIGIIQGRLLPPVDGLIQEFPIKNWESEFEILKTIGLNHIEFIITKKSFSNFLDLDLSKYTKYISGLCCDNLIDEKISEADFLDLNLKPICEIARKFEIKNINIPLLEQSSITDNNKNQLFSNLLEFSKIYDDLNFNFEIEDEYNISLELLNLSDNFYFIYDTGNLNFIGVDHYEYINKVFHKISNVHLKDRNKMGSHPPGEGDVNFSIILQTLSELNYKNIYTLQTCRRISSNEIETAISDIKYFNKIYQII
jgi:hypothetical protein